MKKTYILLISVYIFLIIYFAVFNWEIFTLSINISLGFTIINIPLISILFFFGFLFLMFQWILIKIVDLKHGRELIKKENEVKSVKSSLYDFQAPENESIIAHLGYMDSKLDKIMDSLEIRNENKSDKSEP